MESLQESTPLAPTIEYDQFAKIALRVGQVRVAELVPKSKKLLRLEVDLGPQYGVRQVLAGLQQHYTPEALIGRKIVVVANLVPAKLAGLESQAMVLASSNGDGDRLILVDPGEVEPGAEVR